MPSLARQPFAGQVTGFVRPELTGSADCYDARQEKGQVRAGRRCDSPECRRSGLSMLDAAVRTAACNQDAGAGEAPLSRPPRILERMPRRARRGRTRASWLLRLRQMPARQRVSQS